MTCGQPRVHSLGVWAARGPRHQGSPVRAGSCVGWMPASFAPPSPPRSTTPLSHRSLPDSCPGQIPLLHTIPALSPFLQGPDHGCQFWTDRFGSPESTVNNDKHIKRILKTCWLAPSIHPSIQYFPSTTYLYASGAAPRAGHLAVNKAQCLLSWSLQFNNGMGWDGEVGWADNEKSENVGRRRVLQR